MAIFVKEYLMPFYSQSFIDSSWRDKASWWLGISRNMSPDFGFVCDCTSTKCILIYNTTGMNELEDCTQTLLGEPDTTEIFIGCHSVNPRKTTGCFLFGLPFMLSPPVQSVQGLFPWGKSVGAWCCPPTPLYSPISDWLPQHLCFPSVPSLYVTGRA
jgi:hypothetical protein